MTHSACQHGKGQEYQHGNAGCICGALNCGILDVIELEKDENNQI